MKKRRSSSSQPPAPKTPASPGDRAPSPGTSSPAAADLEVLSNLPPETPEPRDATAAPPVEPADVDLETVRFGYFNPDASEVFVAGTFNNWDPRALPMERDATGNWSVKLSLPSGEYLYRLVVDGEWRDHPGAAREIPGPLGGNNAVLTV